MLLSNTVVARPAESVKSLETLLALLQTLQVTRFSVERVVGAAPNLALSETLKQFTESVAAFEIGRVLTTGWPGEPQSKHCWSWNANVYEKIRALVPRWISTQNVREVEWSFFRTSKVALHIPSAGYPVLTDVLPAELVEIQLLDFTCEVKQKKQSNPKKLGVMGFGPEPQWHFGPHLKKSKNGRYAPRPHWWGEEHDALIVKQVNQEQWHWRQDYKKFIDSLDAGDLQEYVQQWNQFVASGLTYGPWYNGIGSYIMDRALEIGAHQMVTVLPCFRVCCACEEEFHETSTHTRYLGFRQIDSCRACIDKAFFSGERDDLTKSEITIYLRELNEVLGKVPENNFGNDPHCLRDLDTPTRSGLLRTLQQRPSIRLIKNQYKSWFNALIEAGILDQGARRQVLGTTCLASDGHLCLSLAEKRIDDVLTSPWDSP